MSPGENAATAQHADARLCCFTGSASEAARSQVQRWGAVPSARPASTPESDAALADAAAIIFTCCTSGTTKGVVVSHRGLLQFGHVSSGARVLTERDRTYAFVLMTHIFALARVRCWPPR